MTTLSATATISEKRSYVFKNAWKTVKEFGKSLSEALKSAWSKIKKTMTVTQKVIELIQGKKFNGKVYGFKQKSIYLDGDKVEISEEYASILEKVEDTRLRLDYGITVSWYESKGKRVDVKFKNPDGFSDSVVSIEGKIDLIENTKLEVLASKTIDGIAYAVCRVTVYEEETYYVVRNEKSESVSFDNVESLLEELA